uniref:ABC transporter permease n=1 Tax=Angiostrongylus cantonensis TaxID=6313 RepID=A0A0K0D1H7_ANGCA
MNFLALLKLILSSQLIDVLVQNALFFLDPAVSISLFLTRQFDVVSTATFVVVQLFGAFLGAVIFRALVSDVIFEDYFIGAYVITGDERDAITRSQVINLERLLLTI